MSLSSSDIVIFSIPKAFTGEFALIQENAIFSWLAIARPENVWIFGDEDGVAQVCKKYGVRHFPKVVRTNFGSPLLNEVFSNISESKYKVYIYVNADIVLIPTLLDALSKITVLLPNFLVVSRRWDCDIKFSLDQTIDWANYVDKFVQKNGELHPAWGIDIFVMTSYFIRNLSMPPFSVGRVGWDNWMIWRSKQMQVPVVDITQMGCVLHQNHGYTHLLGGAKESRLGNDAQRNLAFAKSSIVYDINSSDYIYKNGEIAFNHLNRLYPTLRRIGRITGLESLSFKMRFFWKKIKFILRKRD